MVSPVKTGDLHVAWLRAQIKGDETAMRQIMDQLSAPGEIDPVVPLVYAAFVIAVRKAFGAEFSRGEVIRLVANVRVMLSNMPGVVDPVAAETEIRRALGEDVPVFGDGSGTRPTGAVRSADNVDDLRVALLSPGEVMALDELLESIEARRAVAQREIDMLDELCRLATSGLTDGTLTVVVSDDEQRMR